MEKILLYFVYLMVFYTMCEAIGQKSIEMTKVKLCPADNSVDAGIELYKNMEGKLAFKARLKLDYDLDDNYKVNVLNEIWKDNQWQTNMARDETWCIVMDMFLQLWQQAKQEMRPPLTNFDNSCSIPAGQYTLDNYQVSRANAEPLIRSMEVGKYKNNIKLYTEYGGTREDILCLDVEFEIAEM